MTTESGSSRFGVDPNIQLFVQSRVPSIPDEFFLDPTRRVSELLSHTQRQALLLACSQLDDGIDRANLTENATVADLAYWLGNLLNQEASPIERGDYRTAHVQLRPIEESDILALYRASLDPKTNHRWRFRGRTPALDQFRQSLFADQVLAQFMVAVANHPDRIVGLVSAYSGDLVSGFAFVSFQRIHPSFEGVGSNTGGLMVEGMLVFFQYLFDHFDLHKVYLELPEYNRSLLPGEGGLLSEEGRMRDHYWFGGRRWDQFIFALYREEWDQVASQYLEPWSDSHFERWPV